NTQAGSGSSLARGFAYTWIYGKFAGYRTAGYGSGAAQRIASSRGGRSRLASAGSDAWVPYRFAGRTALPHAKRMRSPAGDAVAAVRLTYFLPLPDEAG